MIRSLLLVTLLAPTLHAQPNPDPAFNKIPFQNWLTEPNQTTLHWTAAVPRAQLSFHQRLTTRIEFKLDGRDLDTRRADGTLLFLLQITDSQGTRYQHHGTIDLSTVDPNVKSSIIEYSQRAFFLPGTYSVAVAILYTRTGEHATRQLQFRVPPPPHEAFFTTAWHALPTVEFVGKDDNWYLPEVDGRLQWAAAIHSPAQLDIILNVAPHRFNAADQAALLPTIKALTQSGSPSLTENLELLDLSRRRVAFSQHHIHELDWRRLQDSLGESNTSSIDIHSLTDRHHNAQFFVQEVRRVLRPAQQPCVLVILTPPVAFEPGEDFNPISSEALPACRVIYIRYRPRVEITDPISPPFESRRREPTFGYKPPLTIDELESSLKPLDPKVLDISSPEPITKALIEIEKLLH